MGGHLAKKIYPDVTKRIELKIKELSNNNENTSNEKIAIQVKERTIVQLFKFEKQNSNLMKFNYIFDFYDEKILFSDEARLNHIRI